MTHLDQPGIDYFLNLRHPLYMLDHRGTHNAETLPHDAYFLCILHSCVRERYLETPSLEQQHLPAKPYTLDPVLLIPEQDDFVPADRTPRGNSSRLLPCYRS